MEKDKFTCYQVQLYHFDEYAQHYGYFRLVDNAIKKAKEVIREKQVDLEMMRKLDNGISGYYDQDFKAVPIEHRHIYFEMASKTESVTVEKMCIETED